MQSEVTEKKHVTAITSVQSWKIVNNNGTRLTERKKIFEAIEVHGPITSRRLSEITKIERSSVCRCIYDLLGEIQPQIKIAYSDKCPTTRRTVQYYSHVCWKPQPLKQAVLEMEASQS